MERRKKCRRRARSLTVEATDSRRISPSSQNANDDESGEVASNSGGGGDNNRGADDDGSPQRRRAFSLERRLAAAQAALAAKTGECERLQRAQSALDAEVHALSEALFLEAHRMVGAADARRVKAERLLVEARLEAEALVVEVQALRRSDLDAANAATRKPTAATTPTKRRSSSRRIRRIASLFFPHQQRQRASPSPPPPSIIGGVANRTLVNTSAREMGENAQRQPLLALASVGSTAGAAAVAAAQDADDDAHIKHTGEIDPVYYRDLAEWRENAMTLDESELRFLKRILEEEVAPCLHFINSELSAAIHDAIKADALEMESIVGEVSPHVECALFRVQKSCPFRLRIRHLSPSSLPLSSPRKNGDDSDGGWLPISLLARNRIAAVCDFYTYIRYLRRGLLRPSLNDAYWSVAELRATMCLARLGFHITLKAGGAAVSGRSDGRTNSNDAS